MICVSLSWCVCGEGTGHCPIVCRRRRLLRFRPPSPRGRGTAGSWRRSPGSPSPSAAAMAPPPPAPDAACALLSSPLPPLSAPHRSNTVHNHGRSFFFSSTFNSVRLKIFPPTDPPSNWPACQPRFSALLYSTDSDLTGTRAPAPLSRMSQSVMVSPPPLRMRSCFTAAASMLCPQVPACIAQPWTPDPPSTARLLFLSSGSTTPPCN